LINELPFFFHQTDHWVFALNFDCNGLMVSFVNNCIYEHLHMFIYAFKSIIMLIFLISESICDSLGADGSIFFC
jgi:hypothetical protein